MKKRIIFNMFALLLVASLAFGQSQFTGSSNNSYSGYDVDALYSYGGTTTRATLSAALTAAGTTDKATLLLRPGTWTITEDLTIPANVTLKVPAGALLTISNTKTLTINGPLDAGLYKLFSCTGTGKITFGYGSVPVIYPQWWGAIGDGSTDNSAALNAAFAQAGLPVFIPKGTYNVVSNLTEPVCASISGAGENYSIIAAQTGVTKVLSLGSECNKLSDFQITGNATTHAIGILFGDAESGGYQVTGVRVKNFTGTEAAGIKLYQVLKSSFRKITVEGCTVNLLIDGTGSGGFPTTCDFYSSTFRTAKTIGIKGVAGCSINFWGCTIESNTQEGVKLVTASRGTLTDIAFNNCWLENNYGSNAKEYQFVANGSAGGGCTVRPIIRDCYFQSSGAMSIKMTGAGTAGFQISNIIVPITSATVLIESSAYGRIDNWSATIAYGTVVSDTARSGMTPSLGADSSSAAWIDYTPTYSSDVGNIAATFSGAVATTLARFRKIGKLLQLQLNYSGKLNAMTPNYIAVSLPTGLSTRGNSAYAPFIAKNGTTYEQGHLRWTNGNTIFLYRSAFANYSSGAAIGGQWVGEIELQ